MNHALRYLAARSATNALRRALDALRRPSRLVGLVVGVAYLLWLSRHAGAASVPDPRQAAWLGALGLLLLATTAWLLGTVGSRAGAGATRALLLPAPIPDRSLVALTLLAGQAVVLPNVALWTLLGSRGATPVVLLQRAAGLWLLFTTIMCHRALVARVRGGETGPRWLRRGGTLLGLMMLACVPFVLTGSFELAAGGWRNLAPTGLGRSILGPFAIPVRPVITQGAEWYWAAGAALLLLAVHVALLLRLGPSREAAHASGRVVGPAVSLPERGATSLAAWKAVTATIRRADLIRLAGAALAGAVALRALRTWGSDTAAEFAGFLALTWAPLVLLLGPQFLRAGLRRDAGRIPLLRTLPARGREWLLGGALAGGLVTALLAGGLLLVGIAGAGASAELGVPVGVRVAAAAAAAILVVPVAMLATLVQDGLLLFFPGPLSLGSTQPGATRLGTTLVNSVLSAAILVLLLAVPGALAVGVTHLLPWPLPARIVVAALVAAALSLGEAIVAAAWLGTRLERAEAAA